MSDLQVSNGRKLSLIAKFGVKYRHHAPWIEKLAHAVLKEHAVSGEWFRVSPIEARNTVAQIIVDSYFHNDGEKLREDVSRALWNATMDSLFGGAA